MTDQKNDTNEIDRATWDGREARIDELLATASKNHPFASIMLLEAIVLAVENLTASVESLTTVMMRERPNP